MFLWYFWIDVLDLKRRVNWRAEIWEPFKMKLLIWRLRSWTLHGSEGSRVEQIVIDSFHQVWRSRAEWSKSSSIISIEFNEVKWSKSSSRNFHRVRRSRSRIVNDNFHQVQRSQVERIVINSRRSYQGGGRRGRRGGARWITTCWRSGRSAMSLGRRVTSRSGRRKTRFRTPSRWVRMRSTDLPTKTPQIWVHSSKSFCRIVNF